MRPEKPYFSIGEVAKMKDVTIKALRHYHEMGLLIPAYIDEATGYRYYSIEQFLYIDMIRFAINAGTSLKELNRLLKNAGPANLEEFVDRKIEETKDSIDKLNRSLEHLNSFKQAINASKDSFVEDYSHQHFHTRFVIKTPCATVGDLQELKDYAYLEKLVKEKGLDITFRGGIIYCPSIEEGIQPESVFMEIDQKQYRENDAFFAELPQGNYLIMNYSRENEQEKKRELLDYLKRNNLKPAQFLDVYILTDVLDTQTYHCQFQVLVE